MSPRSRRLSAILAGLALALLAAALIGHWTSPTVGVALAQIIAPNPTATLPSSGPPLLTRTPTPTTTRPVPTPTQQAAITAAPGGLPLSGGPTPTPTRDLAALLPTPTAPLVPSVGLAPTPFGVEVLPGDFRPIRIEMLQTLYVLPTSDQPRPPLIRRKESLVRVWVVLDDAPTDTRNATVQLSAFREGQELPGCGTATQDVQKSVPGSLATFSNLDEFVGPQLGWTFNFQLPGGCNWLDGDGVTIRAHVIGPECTACVANNTLDQSFSFIQMRPLRIRFHFIQYDGEVPEWTYAGLVPLLRAYPISTLDIDPVAPVIPRRRTSISAAAPWRPTSTIRGGRTTSASSDTCRDAAGARTSM